VKGAGGGPAYPARVATTSPTPASAADLAAAWRRLVPDSPASRAVGAELLARWAEPHRRYHTLDHLRAVLAAVDRLAHLAADADAVRLAAWFHDAVYEGRAGWDEERSAQLAEAARLVRLTAAHAPEPGDRDGAVLCDADLAILAAPPDGYAAYAAAVREEYRHVPDAAFAAGRAGVLSRLLAMPRLFRTPVARELWEERARANLAAELARLAEPAPPQPGGGEPPDELA